MSKLKLFVFPALLACLLLAVACSSSDNGSVAVKGDAKPMASKAATYDRGALVKAKADFSLAKSKETAKTGTDKARCFTCHGDIETLHGRGMHKNLDCSNCHEKITTEHMDDPNADNRPTVRLDHEACGTCHANQMHSFQEIGMHRPARFEKSNINGRSPNPAWDKLMAPYGFTKEHAATRSHAAMLIDQFVVDRAFGGQFQPKAGWNYIFQAGPVWDVLFDAKEKNPDFKNLPHTARAVNPVCMNCKTMDHMMGWAFLGNPEPGTTWSRVSNPAEMAKHMNNALNCFFCHDPHSAEPRIVRDALINAIDPNNDAPYVKNNLYQSDPNHVKAEIIEMGLRGFTRKIAILEKDNTRRQSLQCAQCHVEYNCGAGTDLASMTPAGMADPRTNHMPLKNALALYDHYVVNLKFADFKNKFSGTLLWKGQHPEFETQYNSKHDKAGVSCVQCHLEPVQKDGKFQYTSHFVQSPRFILNSTCLTSDCHGMGAEKHPNWAGKDATYVKVSTNWTEKEAKYSIDSIKLYHQGKMRKAEFWIATLIDAIKQAELAGVSQDVINQARTYHQKAHILWEYWTAENSDGFHNPEVARESLTNSIMNAEAGYDLIAAALKQKVAKR